MPDSKPIQTLPCGLLGFLQLKNLGQNPSILPDTIQSTLDLREWLLETNAENPLTPSSVIVTSGVVGLVLFTTLPLIVPDREWWFVENYTLTMGVVPAGDEIAAAPAMRTSVAGAPQQLILAPEFEVEVSTVNQSGCASARDFWLGPNMELGAWVNRVVAAGNLTIAARVRFTRLPI